MPNKYEVFLDNSLSDYEDRLEMIDKLILSYNNGQWLDYFNDGWLRISTVSGVVKNNTQEILDRVATYLLTGQFKDSNVLTRRRANNIRQKEIPISNTGDGVKNLVYSLSIDDGDSQNIGSASSELSKAEVSKDVYDMTSDEIEDQKKKARKSKKKWKQTKTYKLNRLYSTTEVRTYRVKPVKDSSGNIVKDKIGKPIFDVIYVTIGGHQGLFDKPTKFANVPTHLAKWCIVDTENIFEFNGKTYRINSSVKQYAVISGKANMDKILCYLTKDGTMYFYDENIEHLDGSMIKEVAID